MALTKAHNRMIQGSRFHIDDYGAVGDGVTDDTAANSAPTAGGVEPIGWVCTVAGTPGTWAGFGTIA